MDLNRWKKAISVGMSASLLASLFTVIAASSVLAAANITSAGSVARGSTTTGTVTITLTENTAACLTAVMVGQSPNPAVPDDIRVALTDFLGSAATVDFAGTPTITAPGSLGASAAVSGGDLVIQLTGTDTVNVEQIIVTGLTVSTTSGAALGAVTATLTGAAGVPGCFLPGTVTATGVIAVGIAAGSTSVLVNVDDCAFDETDLGDLVPGPLSFATLPETRNISLEESPPALGVGPGQQRLTIQATANTHQLGEVVSQTGVPNCNLLSGAIGTAATVTGRIDVSGTTGTNVFPGENNQVVTGATVILTTPGAGSTTDGLPSGSVVTFTLPTGIQYSLPPTVAYGGTITGPATCALSFDRNSCSLTTTATSAAASTITLSNFRVDVASTVALGTAVTVTPTSSPARTFVPSSFRIAFVQRTVVGVGGIPTIFINVNDQNTGQLTLTETSAGFFRAGVGENNAFGICFTTGEQLTRAPWAVVTSGDLLLLSGATGAASAAGTLFSGPAIAGGFQSCARWTVFGRASTPVVSTIEIRGADASNVVLPSGANNGPRVNVVPGVGVAGTPGPTLVNVLVGQQADVALGAGLTTSVQNAVRAFQSGVNVVALSQPIIGQGTTGLAGNIRISETLAGQFKLNELICVTILPRSSITGLLPRQDTFLATATTNQLPAISTNVASGLLASRTSTTPTGVCFTINQQASGTLGELTISNLNFTTLADAPFGPILVTVTGSGVGVAFEATVSNARIGNPQAGTAATRLGVTQVGAFTISTKIPRVNRYVTYRFDFGVAAAGQAVRIHGATKTGNDWSAFTVVTTRIANASGVVYYHIRHNAPTWRSYRANWVGGGAWTPARQARWIP
jgi:hypothetical protein